MAPEQEAVETVEAASRRLAELEAQVATYPDEVRHLSPGIDPALREEFTDLQDETLKAQRTLELAQARIEEAPLLADLRAIGVQVPTVWDLYLHPDAYPEVIPVLLEHLRRDYPDRTLEGIARSLKRRSIRRWWNEVKEIYLTDERKAVRECLAMVLAAVAVREHFDDVLALFRNTDLGSSRIFFVRPINKIGNRMSPGRGRAAIEPYANDPVLGAEVTAVLRGRGHND